MSDRGAGLGIRGFGLGSERRGGLRASGVWVACLFRHLPLFFSAEPRTPLRVLGIVVFDTLHILRHSQRLPQKRARELAMFLDFQGCANAAWDQKELCQAEYRAVRQRLKNAGLGSCIEAYLSRLGELERRRPPIGGDRRRFDEVRSYREGVAWLSIATAAAIALNADDVNREIRTAQYDSDVDTLFRILMQCQIIDDVMDYAEDLSARLPSFLTASASLPQAMELTAKAASDYGAPAERSSGDAVFPLRVGLSIFTAATRLVVRVACWRRQSQGDNGEQMEHVRLHVASEAQRASHATGASRHSGERGRV